MQIAAAVKSALRASVLRRSFADFARQAWPAIAANPLDWSWHHDLIAGLLQRITDSDPATKRVIINIPPGCSKSALVTLWSAWEWAEDPSHSYLTFSYSDANTIRDNRRVRDIVLSDWYRESFPHVVLSTDQTAKVRFDTTARGWRIASSVGGVGTGEHPTRIVIDDPHRAQDALSPVMRQSVVEWYDTTVSTRVSQDPTILIIMQRLHQDDLTGTLLSRGGWHHLCLPMRFEPAHPHRDPRDPRTRAGELLWPSHFTEARVRALEIELGAYGAAGQLQQTPVPEGGGLFKREWLPVVDVLPAEAEFACRGWDTAATEQGGDYTVGVRIAKAGDLYYVTHVVRAQLGPGSVDALIRAMATSDGYLTLIREEQEGGSAGKTVTSARARALQGYDYAAVPVTSQGKVLRANPFRAQCEAGNVRILRGEWTEAYLDELCAFPYGKHDDQVDASSCAFNSMSGMSAILAW